MTNSIIYPGDCRDIMRVCLEPNSIDSICTDPPYGLSKEPDMAEVLRHWLAGDDYVHGSAGFMGRTWDSFVPGPAVWREAYRVLKPGGYLVAFFGTRTYDMGVLAIRLAGFEIRDQLAWVFGSGFPKSHDVSKAMDRMAGVEREVLGVAGVSGASRNCMRDDFAGGAYLATIPATDEARQWSGWGTALKPAQEPIVVARKPLSESSVAANVLRWGTGAVNIDGCRIEGAKPDTTRGASSSGRAGGVLKAQGRIVDDGRGRWPANLLHDGSDEVLARFPDSKSTVTKGHDSSNRLFGGGIGARSAGGYTDEGSAARFFYCAKASGRDRDEGLEDLTLRDVVTFQTANGTSGEASSWSEGRETKRRNPHPTVKPTDLMRWLVRLVTPPGGVVLDPFTGSGSTGKAAALEGFDFIGCELTLEYIAVAQARIAWAQAQQP